MLVMGTATYSKSLDSRSRKTSINTQLRRDWSATSTSVLLSPQRAASRLYRRRSLPSGGERNLNQNQLLPCVRPVGFSCRVRVFATITSLLESLLEGRGIGMTSSRSPELRGHRASAPPSLLNPSHPAFDQPHFDQLGAGLGSGCPRTEQLVVTVVPAKCQTADRWIFQPAFVNHGRGTELVDQLGTAICL